MAKGSSKRKPTASPKLGALPEWNLNDLYPGPDSPQLKWDLENAETRCVAFEADFKGKLAALAAGPEAGKALGAAVKRYEALDDTLGRIMSYASLRYAGDTDDPAVAKFYGDMQERITAASLHLLFFTLELNRIDDAKLEAAMADPALGHYRPWIEDVRKEKPYQLEDRVEELFHEKSVTGYSAWNRNYDETIASLRFKIGGKPLTIEPALNLLQDADGKKRKAAAQALAKTFKANLRPFALITNTLAKDKEISDRWRGFKDVAGARHLSNRVEPEVVEALVAAVRAAYPKLSHRYYALKAKWFGKKRLPYWDRNAPLPKVAQRTIPWSDARATVLTAYGAFSPKMAEVADRFFEKNWIDAPVRAGKQPGAFCASDRAVGASVCAAQLPGQAARRDDAGARTRPRRASGAGGAERRADGADAAHARRNRQRVRRDAHLQEAPGADHRQEAAQGHARRQGRGHDQHGGAADRVLFVRAQGAYSSAAAANSPPTRSANCGCRCKLRAWVPQSSSKPATRRSGATSRTSSIRRSTSTLTHSATAW